MNLTNEGMIIHELASKIANLEIEKAEQKVMFSGQINALNAHILELKNKIKELESDGD